MMLRVGLTGGLGSGKSTVGRMLAARGAYVLSSDEIGRALMQSGQPVYQAILNRFGSKVLNGQGELDRTALARIVFEERPDELEALNAIVHPAVIRRQAELIEQIAAADPNAIVVVESALLFETAFGGPEGWHKRFDCIVLVRATDELKIARHLRRTLGEATPTEAELARYTADAERRIARQLSDKEKARSADFVLTNNGSLMELERQVDELWQTLLKRAGRGGSLPATP